jgi:hypothetical protein
MSKLLTATVIGFTAITLFGRAGDFVRPYLIAVKEQVPLTSQLTQIRLGTSLRRKNRLDFVHTGAGGVAQPAAFR